jgi:hypothetical protein
MFLPVSVSPSPTNNYHKKGTIMKKNFKLEKATPNGEEVIRIIANEAPIVEKAIKAFVEIVEEKIGDVPLDVKMKNKYYRAFKQTHVEFKTLFIYAKLIKFAKEDLKAVTLDLKQMRNINKMVKDTFKKQKSGNVKR